MVDSDGKGSVSDDAVGGADDDERVKEIRSLHGDWDKFTRPVSQAVHSRSALAERSAESDRTSMAGANRSEAGAELDRGTSTVDIGNGAVEPGGVTESEPDLHERSQADIEELLRRHRQREREEQQERERGLGLG